MERALLVTVKLDSEKDQWRLEDSAQELEELAAACLVDVVDNIPVLRDRPTANLFVGKGKAEELSILAQEENIDTVVFNHDLTGTQQRNLEDILGKKVIDRTQLILDIFARHAKTPEGKMQVELAQLQYLMPRLVGKDSDLDRLGGVGMRGPGEQKLEIDRRRIRKHIDSLKEDLKQLALHRQTIRKRRKENSIPSVALVGYTSAGKSTLLNTLTGAGQTVSSGLFTTLDPLSKNLQLPSGENIVISDTVGFLHNLPHHLVEAFKATLEEVMEADVLLHVLDINNPLAKEHTKACLGVLKDLGAGEKKIITVLNKVDLLTDLSWLENLSCEFVNPVVISAKTGQNIDKLLERIADSFESRMKLVELIVPHGRMDLIDLFYREGQVKKVEYTEKGIEIEVNLPKIICAKVFRDKSIKIID